MRLATLILPTHDNSGADLADCHAALQSALVERWHGFTMTQASGAWSGPDGVMSEPVAVYAIAMEDSANDRECLESIAFFYGVTARQISVMVYHARGDVSFIACIGADSESEMVTS